MCRREIQRRSFFISGKALGGILLVMVLAAQLHAESRLITIGVESGAYFPMYDDSSGQYRGFSRDLLDQFALFENIRITYKILPLKRLTEYAKGERIDLRFPDNPYWETEAKADAHFTYSHPVVTYIDGTLVKPERVGLGLEKLHELGIVSGFTPWPYFNAIKQQKVQVKENNSRLGLLQQVLLERIDGAYTSVVVANYQMAHELEQPGKLVFDPSLPYVKSHYYLSTVHHPELITRFNRFLTEQAPLVEALKQHYRVEEGLAAVPDS
ncbi:MAG: ABC transporter substrate-binding protein [Hahellaceae bacterium]|nr:ABC transporter substrate-binding protein [Hahellaceae bacterium]MCP5170083.1 ABC transporter substrate-binding protein [Hahellaceae bacterium]